MIARRAAGPALAAAATAAILLLGTPAPPPAGATGSGSTASARQRYAVGEVVDTFVDTSRPTAAWGGQPAEPSRTLVTTILYPATGAPSPTPVPSAAPDTAGGPYPLIGFAHGLGATPSTYMALLEHWAAAGFVVAAPAFPLTNTNTPGGADAGDVVNQPADMRFVIDSVLARSAGHTGPLAGMIDPHEVGAAGHSNGAITTLGLVANTCCRDPQVRAAVVMAGATEGFPHGHYDLSAAPPLLLVHDTADGLIPYADAIGIFDQARGPKGLLTVTYTPPNDPTGVLAHMAASGEVGPSATAVFAVTTDFFDAYLRGDKADLGAMATAAHTPYTALHADWTKGSRARMAVPKAPVVHLHASVTPSTGLVAGQAVTVRWSGYTAGKVVNVLECSSVDIATASSAGCSFANAAILHPDPTGSGSLTLDVLTGTVGNGTCGAAHPCWIVVNDASSTNPADSRVLKISFAG